MSSTPSSGTVDTVWPADSIEFCPHPDFTSIFVCGTYYLDQNQSATDQLEEPRPQKRLGKCMLFDVSASGAFNIRAHIQDVDFPAVPDLKWCHRTTDVPPVVAVADSEGNISLLHLEAKQKRLLRLQSISCADSHVLCLSLDWSNRRTPTSGLAPLIASLSDGNLVLLQPDHSGLVLAESWHAHDFEPWVAAWNYWDTNVIYSGGDDLKLKAWDIRQGFWCPIFTNKRFDAGVTSIQSHPYVEHLLAVGSYDNTVRLFDARKPQTPLTQADVGGGAWRVKWHPLQERKRDLLVASMHDGAKIVRFSDSLLDPAVTSSSWELARRFDGHESMTYGADWSFNPQGFNHEWTQIASCSFYDHALHVWDG